MASGRNSGPLRKFGRRYDNATCLIGPVSVISVARGLLDLVTIGIKHLSFVQVGRPTTINQSLVTDATRHFLVAILHEEANALQVGKILLFRLCQRHRCSSVSWRSRVTPASIIHLERFSLRLILPVSLPGLTGQSSTHGRCFLVLPFRPGDE